MTDEKWVAAEQDWTKMTQDFRNDIPETDIRLWQADLFRKFNDEIQEEKTHEIAQATKELRRSQLMRLVAKLEHIPSHIHRQLVEEIVTDMFHFGPVDELWSKKDTVTDIQMLIPIDDTKEQIITYKDRSGRQRFNGTGFRNYRHSLTWLNTHLTQVKARYDPGDIEYNTTFPSGERMHILSPSCAAYSHWHPTKGYEFVPCLIISVRRLLKPFTLDEMTNFVTGETKPPVFENLKEVKRPYNRIPQYFRYEGGLADPATMEYFKLVGFLRKTHLIFGETGAGKSTIQGSITREYPKHALMLCLEESNDSQPQCAGHVIRLKEVKDKFSLEDCMKASLRMYPDIIQLSEVRDKIAHTFIRGIQSGHEGSSTTLHASSCLDGIDVTVNLSATHESHPDREEIRNAIYRNVHTALHIQVEKGENGDDRFVDEVVQLLPNGEFHTVMTFTKVGVHEDGTLAGYFNFFGPNDQFVEEMFSNGIPIPEVWGWNTESLAV